MKKRTKLIVIAISLLSLKGCFLAGLGWKYLPYVECFGDQCVFDEWSYDRDHDDDDDCEWYKWPIDCY